MPTPPIALTRQHLESYLACQRQFQLRYLEQYPWPAPPPPAAGRVAVERGRQFHQMAQRYFLELPTSVPGGDPVLHDWWATFLKMAPELPLGRRLPEMTVTVPLRSHLLLGRLDLLILPAGSGAHIFDWKTGALPSKERLAQSWQMLLYPALVTGAGQALRPGGGVINPDDVTFTYWSVVAPDSPVRFEYSAAKHKEIWQRLGKLVETIEEAQQDETSWSLTDDLSICSRCHYRVLCGRQAAVAQHTEAWDDEGEEATPPLEPDLP